MATGNGRAAASMVSVPDLQGVFEQWQSASAQSLERSTGMAREFVGAGLHWMVQGAEGARHWAHALDATAQHWSELARTAEHKLRTIDDVAGLWNLELDVAGHGAETGVDWGQQVWAEQMRAWSALAQDNAAQAARLMQSWSDGGDLAHDADGAALASGPPPAPFALPTLASAPELIKSLAEASQAFWSTAAAQASAAMHPAAPPEPGAAEPTPRPRRARRRG
jgi:hypothetical protein